MNRFFNCRGIVLRQRAYGESNREGYFLTPDYGMLRCTVYGGPKSKLRSIVSAFHSGILYAYHDPVRDTYKVQDFDVQAWRMGLRENYERTMTAMAICETVLAGHSGAGNWQDAYTLTTKSLDALETAVESTAKRIFVHFLWNWAQLLGIIPDYAKEVEDADLSNITHSLHPIHQSSTHIAALNWLKVSAELDPSILYRLDDDPAAIEAAKNHCMKIIANSLGYSVKSWSLIA
ncbi:MAG: hypothetical protein Ta2B_23800 [Termitinemataceae bacterium]|nr:MAG: hypothetical protein Ta2B_23800 [Termitinemataceae bacterium]